MYLSIQANLSFFQQVGVTTDEIDELVHNLCIAHNAYPSPLNYHSFPKSVCTSVNNVACHGIPDSRQLEDGDIINIDVTVRLVSLPEIATVKTLKVFL